MTTPLTLRQIAGLCPPESIEPGHTALILIDIQNDYFNPQGLLIPEGARVLANAARLMDAADASGMVVIHIQQVSPNPISPIFAEGSEGVAIHASLAPRPAHQRIQKQLPSSFAGTTLEACLRAQGIETLILAGMMTHMCVDSTARDALHRGYRVLIASDACASRDLPDDRGGVVDAETVHRATLAALADRFADVMTTEALCGLLHGQ